ncbi:mitochondrial nucleoid-associated protein 1-like [Hyperolius riggenbachi]|uniref:mitochondrial nucleoid-associated protein 1-like n=1 Tax=Hyperolius riggenbachi TaxID=752182 RepID=UPI0035A26794
MDICPFCGKAFKRLKSHLPHCKMAAATDKSPAAHHSKKTLPLRKTKKTLLSTPEQQSPAGGGSADIKKQGQDTKKKLQFNSTTSLARRAQTLLPEVLSRDRVMASKKQKKEDNWQRNVNYIDSDHSNNISHCIDEENSESEHFSLQGQTASSTSEGPKLVPFPVQVTDLPNTGLKTLIEIQDPSRKSPNTGLQTLTEIQDPSRKSPNTGLQTLTEIQDPSRKSPNTGLQTLTEIQDPSRKSPNTGLQTLIEIQDPSRKSPNTGLKTLIEIQDPSRKSPNTGLQTLTEILDSPRKLPNTGLQTLTEIQDPSIKHLNTGLQTLKEIQDPSKKFSNTDLKTLTEILDSSRKLPNTGLQTLTQILDSPRKLPDAGLITLPEIQVPSRKSPNTDLQTIQDSSRKTPVDNVIIHWPGLQEAPNLVTTEIPGTAGVNVPIKEQVSGKEQLDQCGISTGEHFKRSKDGNLSPNPSKHHLELVSKSSPLLCVPIEAATSPLRIALENIRGQLPAVSDKYCTRDVPQVQTRGAEDIESIEKYSGGHLVHTTIRSSGLLNGRDVGPSNGSLGLEWMPELYSNYTQLSIVPNRSGLMGSHRRISIGTTPGGADSAQCKPPPCEPIPEVPLESRRLMDVRIGELSSWVGRQRWSLRSIAELGPRAWDRYYNKYINVKKGGVGGLAMLLAGYCVLSYSWNFHHIRNDRWRKYH